MKQRGTEIVVGLFVLAGLAVVIGGIFTIRGRTFGTLRRYHVRYENVSSLTADTAVKYNGLLVGRVEALGVDPEDTRMIRVTLAVAAGTPVTTDTIAQITRSDLLGDEFIDLRPLGERQGTAGSLTARGEPLKPGDFIAAGEPFDLQAALQSLAQTIRRTDDILAQLQGEAQTATATINRILARGDEILSDENVARLQRALDDLASTVGTVRQVAEDNGSRLDQLLLDASAATATLKATTESIRGSVERTLPRIEALTDDVKAAVKKLESLAGTADDTLGTLDVQQLNDLVENLDVASRNLADFTREIKERPYRLVRKERPEEAAP